MIRIASEVLEDKNLDDICEDIRLHRKESPKGLPGKEWFHYLNKNYNFITAVDNVTDCSA